MERVWRKLTCGVARKNNRQRYLGSQPCVSLPKMSKAIIENQIWSKTNVSLTCTIHMH